MENYKIEKLNNTDAVVISDEDVKKSDYIILCDKNILYQVEYKSQENDYNNDTDCKKVIATISPFKIEELPMLELPNQEEDIEKLAHTKYAYISKNPPYTIITPKDKIEGFIEGYKAAQSKKFAVDFAIYLLNKPVTKARSNSEQETYIPKEYKLLQGELLQNGEELLNEFLQKKQFPIAVELTEEEYCLPMPNIHVKKYKLKVIKWHYE